MSQIRALYKIWLKRPKNPWQSCCSEVIMLSKIVHSWILLPNPQDNLVDALQKTVFGFVWNREQDRTSRKTAVKNIVKGGLGIPKKKLR